MRLFGFPQATADAIIDFDIDQELQTLDLDPDPDSATDEARRERQAQYDANEHAHDEQLPALLGQERIGRWQDYMETRGTRMQVDRFRSQLDGADPLRETIGPEPDSGPD